MTLALTIGATLLGAAGSLYSANAAAAAGEYNAKVAEMNATLMDRRAKDAQQRGVIEEQKKRQELAQIKGKQIAAMAANGIDLNFGSPLDTIVDDSVIAELDALTVRRNFAREAYDYQVQGVNLRSEAQLSRMGASAQRTGGWLQAGGTILGGASKGYQDYWASRSSVGAFS